MMLWVNAHKNYENQIKIKLKIKQTDDFVSACTHKFEKLNQNRNENENRN